MAKKNNQTATKNKCQKYEKAITHYVTGEEMGMTKKELFEHLKGCKNCRRDLTEWQDTYAVMCAESFSKTPQGQAKMQKDLTALKEMMKKTSLPIEKSIPARPAKAGGDTKWEIKSAAERIYQVLKENGKTPIPVLRKKAELFDFPFYEALGALADQGRAILHKDKTTYSAEAR